MTVRQILTRGALVAIIAVIAGVIGYAITAGKPKTYEAQAELMFAPRANPLTALGVTAGPLDQGSAAVNNVLDVRSFDVARATADALGDPGIDADSVASSVTATGGAGSDVVLVNGIANSPTQAARIVGTYVRSYIGIVRHRTVVQARAARRDLITALNTLPPILAQGTRGDVLRAQLGQLEVLARNGNTPTIIQHVRASDSPTGPPTQRNTLFGVLFGAVLGIGLVAARAAMRPAIRDY